MGTNYYAVPNRPTTYSPVHIGKSSLGWKFCFQTQDTWGIDEIRIEWNTFPQVKDWLYKWTVEKPVYVIMNEYDEIVPFDDFIEMVERKQKDSYSRDNQDNFSYARNVDGYRFTDEEFS